MNQPLRACGIDGCPNAWIVILQDTASQGISSFRTTDLKSFLESKNCPRVVAIDIPIGLTDSGPRQCDLEARKLLGPRKSSVFPAPIRPVLAAKTRAQAEAISRVIQDKGVGAQAFGIYPKVKEVDDLLQSNPHLHSRIFEVHPELCFRELNGDPMSHPKRSGQGFMERLILIEREFGSGVFDSIRKLYSRNQVADDDILDAFVALWTAKRILAREATKCPEKTELDPTGLEMVMWA